MSRVDIKRIYFCHAVLVINITNIIVTGKYMAALIHFLHTMDNNMLHRCTDGFELIFNSLSVRGSNLFVDQTCKKSCFYKFRKKPIRAFMYIRNKLLCGAT